MLSRTTSLFSAKLPLARARSKVRTEIAQQISQSTMTRVPDKKNLLCASNTLFCRFKSSMSCWCELFLRLINWMYSAAFFKICARLAYDKYKLAFSTMGFFIPTYFLIYLFPLEWGHWISKRCETVLDVLKLQTKNNMALSGTRNVFSYHLHLVFCAPKHYDAPSFRPEVKNIFIICKHFYDLYTDGWCVRIYP